MDAPTRPSVPGRSSVPSSEQLRATISAWGIDLDPADRPAVPKERMPPRLDNVHWQQPSPQPATVEVLQSTEHPVRPPVFGSTCPPRGLSGMLRRRAFRRSENDLRHWLLLLFADRVNAIEGVLQDLTGRSRR